MSYKINYLLLLVDNELQKEIINNFGVPSINIFHKGVNEKIEQTKNFNHIDLIYCNYNDNFLSTLPPLDENLLLKMEEFSNIYFKICARRSKNNTFLTYEEIIDSYHKHLKYWNWEIDKNKLTHLVSYNLPHEGADIIIYALCRIKGIKTFSTYRLPIYPNVISKRYVVNDIFIHKKEKFNEKLNYFGDKKIDPDNLELSYNRLFCYYHPKAKKDRNYSTQKRFTRLTKYKKNSFNYNLDLVIKSFLKDGLKLTIKKIVKRLSFINKIIYRNPFLVSDNVINKKYNLLTTKKIPNKPFIFLALHYQPELSSDILGKYYNEQTLVVDMLAYTAKKFNINIIIKRHPRRDERIFLKPINFYQKMNAHSNVFFVNIDYSTEYLIQESIATASITGSVCWESFLKGKPSLLFGSIIFENAPGTFKIKNRKDLENAIKLILQKQIKFTKKDILNYLKYLEKYTFDCTHKKLIHTATFSIEESSINFVYYLKNFFLD